MKSFPILVGISSLLLAAHTLACSGGQEWIQDDGKYTADITDDTPTIDPGQAVHFDFALINKDDPAFGPQETIPFSAAHVSVVHGEKEMFLKDIPYQVERELTGFDYEFPQQDADYILTVQYKNGRTVLATSHVALKAGAGDARLNIAAIVAVIGGLTLAVLGFQKILRTKKIVSLKFS